MNSIRLLHLADLHEQVSRFRGQFLEMVRSKAHLARVVM